MDSDSPNEGLVSSRLAVVGRLTGHVVHDVNNALSPLVGKLQILRMQEIAEPGNIAGDLEIMEQDSISASRRLQVLSQLSRDALIVEQPKPVVVSDCVREMEFLIGHHLQRRGIEVRPHMDSSMRAALACSIDTKLIIGGLMIATIKTTPSGGVFCIGSSGEKEDRVSLYLAVEGMDTEFIVPDELASLIRAVSPHTTVQVSTKDSSRVTMSFRSA